VLVVLGLGVTGVVVVLKALDGGPVLTERCAALVDGTSWYLSPAQADNAALVASTAVRRGLPARAATVGITTALQESKLINLDHGDRDSLGLFQQRPSQGWGTAAQIVDPVYATNAFYDVLIKINGYQGMDVTEAAQRVQRSGYPEAYRQHVAQSGAWASALTGYSHASVTCKLKPAQAAGSARAVADRVKRDYGDVPTTTTGDNLILTLDAGALGNGSAADDLRLSWSLAQWSVAVAGTLAVDTVTIADQTWTRTDAVWTPSTTSPLPPGKVRVTLKH
jgi:hypothetical protein